MLNFVGAWKKQNDCFECLVLLWGYTIHPHESVDFGDSFQMCLNPALLLAFLSDWASASKEKFSDNPARIFLYDKRNDEEL